MTKCKIPSPAQKLMRVINKIPDSGEHYRTNDPVLSTSKLQGEKGRERRVREGRKERAEGGTYRLKATEEIFTHPCS